MLLAHPSSSVENFAFFCDFLKKSLDVIGYERIIKNGCGMTKEKVTVYTGVKDVDVHVRKVVNAFVRRVRTCQRNTHQNVVRV